MLSSPTSTHSGLNIANGIAEIRGEQPILLANAQAGTPLGPFTILDGFYWLLPIRPQGNQLLLFIGFSRVSSPDTIDVSCRAALALLCWLCWDSQPVSSGPRWGDWHGMAENINAALFRFREPQLHGPLPDVLGNYLNTKCLADSIVS